MLHLLQQVSAGGLHRLHSGASSLSLFPHQHLLIYVLSKPSPATWLLLTFHEIQDVTKFPAEGHHRRVGSRVSLEGFILQPLPLHLQHKLQILEAEKSRAPVFIAELWILVHPALFAHL